jgi:predicted ATP-grasp superfamily ATP-dependent carboligase
MRVLVTGGDHAASLAALRALRSAGYEPWVTASGRKAYGARSRAAAGTIYVPGSHADPAAFVEAVNDAVQRIGFGAIVVGTERDLVALARGRELLGSLAASVPELASVLRVTHKGVVHELAGRVGLRTPATIAVDRGAIREANGLPAPLMVKPLRSELYASGRLVHCDSRRIRSTLELNASSPTPPGDQWLIQAWIKGRLGAICGVAWKGKLVCAVHQVADRIWPWDAGRSAYAHTVGANQALERGVDRLLGELDWSGIFQVQFIHEGDDSYLIDFNPRLYGSLALATAAGANLPAIWVALLSGCEVDSVSYRVGVRYRAAELDLRALMHVIRSGRPVAGLLGLLPRPRTAHAVISLADPLPALTSLGKLRRHVADHRSGLRAATR